MLASPKCSPCLHQNSTAQKPPTSFEVGSIAAAVCRSHSAARCFPRAFLVTARRCRDFTCRGSSCSAASQSASALLNSFSCGHEVNQHGPGSGIYSHPLHVRAPIRDKLPRALTNTTLYHCQGKDHQVSTVLRFPETGILLEFRGTESPQCRLADFI